MFSSFWKEHGLDRIKQERRQREAPYHGVRSGLGGEALRGVGKWGCQDEADIEPACA